MKLLYSRVLASHCIVDGRLDPREIEYLYVFMSRIGLGSDSREEVRLSLGAGDVRPQDLVGLVDEVVSGVREGLVDRRSQVHVRSRLRSEAFRHHGDSSSLG